VLRKGFRPFFLLGAGLGVVLLGAWLMVLFGSFAPRTYFAPIYWHAHEMLFGFSVAIIAGFLLTAVGNWTQKETATSGKLLFLCAVFLAGRLSVTFASLLPRWTPLVVDLAFLPMLAVVLARPIVQTRNHRNLVVVAVVAVLGVLNLLTHLGALGILPDWQRRGAVCAVDVVVLLTSIIAGRVFPMFTRNATRQESIRNLPALDKASIPTLAALLVLDAAGVEGRAQGVVFLLAAVLLAVRAWHWGTRYTARTPLLWILHLGYAWLCVGLLLRGMSAFTAAAPASLGLHALTVGAVGSLTLGMIARVSLGHTGRMLEAPRSVVAGFLAITLAAIARVVGPLVRTEWTRPSLLAAGLLFAAAFTLFLTSYTRLLMTARADGKAG
jgi:uncharacterized protein involved in response to NO